MKKKGHTILILMAADASDLRLWLTPESRFTAFEAFILSSYLDILTASLAPSCSINLKGRSKVIGEH